MKTRTDYGYWFKLSFDEEAVRSLVATVLELPVESVVNANSPGIQRDTPAFYEYATAETGFRTSLALLAWPDYMPDSNPLTVARALAKAASCDVISTPAEITGEAVYDDFDWVLVRPDGEAFMAHRAPGWQHIDDYHMDESDLHPLPAGCDPLAAAA